MVKKDDLLFICDFETTGVNPDIDYPIELGGLITDSELNIIDTYNELIIPDLKTIQEWFIKVNHRDEWAPSFKSAYEVHKIDYLELTNEAITYSEAVHKLNRKLGLIKQETKAKRVIIVSDNAQFEYNFMIKLYSIGDNDLIAEGKWPFHYSSWDTSLILEYLVPEIGDAIPVHRAFQDATRLYRQLVRAFEKLNYFKEKNNGK